MVKLGVKVPPNLTPESTEQMSVYRSFPRFDPKFGSSVYHLGTARSSTCPESPCEGKGTTSVGEKYRGQKPPGTRQ